MRVLCVNSVFSEFGGVEFAAVNLAERLAERGHSVHFLAALGANIQLQPQRGAAARPSRVQVHKRRFPRIFALGEKHGGIKKLVWHLQNLAHPENERQFRSVLEEVRPDICLLHNVTGIGMNIWRTLAAAELPTVQVIHDLGLVCVNMSRFRGGRQCNGLCLPCRAQKAFRFSAIDGKRTFAFVSPSRATLDITRNFVNLDQWDCAVIPNANSFVVETRRARESGPPHILYVGRIDPSKGLDVAVRAADLASAKEDFVFDVLGTGSQEQTLRAEFADRHWLKFHGSVNQADVARMMANASVLVVPSLWPETVPGVAVHALYAGLPVIGSDIGGIPEHVFDEVTGCLVFPGQVLDWRDAILRALRNPDLLEGWSAASLAKSHLFSAEIATDAYEQFMLRQIGKVS